MSVRVKHHAKGYAALLKHPAILADLERRARAIAAAADTDGRRKVGAETSTPIYRRNRAAVIAPMGDPHNQILRNMDSGR